VEIEDATGVRRAGAVRVDVSRLDDTLERLSSLIVARSRLAREIARLHEAGVEVRELRLVERDQARQLRDLRASILALRMVPVAELLDRVPLVVRGLRRTTGKVVQLGIDVGRDELDKGVAERIFPAIVHLVRNAVDHGIEDRAGRSRAGKDEEGRLRIESSAVGSGQLEIRVIDDGRGLDREELARRGGVPVPESESEVLQVLCRAGLSTRDEASDTSGRGMGMDIVRRIIVEQLGGQLSVRSERGVGTTFVLRVPLTISIIDAFTFECAAQRFAVSLASVDEIFEVDPAAVRQGPSGAGQERVGMLERRGAAVSVVRLDAVLGLARGEARGAARKALVLRGGEVPVAFLVDRMIGQQEIVVRPLLDPLVKVAGITGATDLGDGKPTLILDLVALASGLVPSRRTSARARHLELRS
jgi:two-component system chemotaxis sensor kinase CheA